MEMLATNVAESIWTCLLSTLVTQRFLYGDKTLQLRHVWQSLCQKQCLSVIASNHLYVHPTEYTLATVSIFHVAN